MKCINVLSIDIAMMNTPPRGNKCDFPRDGTTTFDEKDDIDHSVIKKFTSKF